MTLPYVESWTDGTITEAWTEIRCPGCIPCGWQDAKLLFRVVGMMIPSGAKLQTRCHRCKSLIEWQVGRPVLKIVEKGRKPT